MITHHHITLMLYKSTAFDPSTCALFAHIMEKVTHTCLCPIRRPRSIPRARQWLHRNSEKAFEVVLDDVAESALDMVNSVDPVVAVVLILVFWLRIVMIAREKKEDCYEIL
jgi:hypothetical protein